MAIFIFAIVISSVYGAYRSTFRVTDSTESVVEFSSMARIALEERFGERPTAAVVTVPADFELHQCQATERAARLAGLDACPLLQEPVAAAQAYGYQDETEQAYWLIYDMGAGTFDVALLRIDGGTLRIAGQRGDGFLGGLRIDEEIVRQCLAPYLAREHGVEVSSLPEGSQVALRMCAEKAKKQLSNPSSRSASVSRLSAPMNPATNGEAGRWNTSSGAPNCATRPASITAMRSASVNASSRSCVTYTAVMPTRRCSSRSSWRRSMRTR